MNPNSFILRFTALMPWDSTELVKPSHRNDDKASSLTFRAGGGQRLSYMNKMIKRTTNLAPSRGG
ncbi:MAG: hypothetical protein ACP5NY_08650, partial [Thermocladium sp.]